VILRWDMMRARMKGQIVYRHMPGLLRIVRGHLMLAAKGRADLGQTELHGNLPVRLDGAGRPAAAV
jgi:hypothetical protein